MEFNAVARRAPRRLRPDESHLMSPGHQLLTTTHGDFDCLGTIDDGKGYEDLLAFSVDIHMSGGAILHVLDLPTLIASKEKAARPKDLAALPYLRATLDESRRRRER